MTCRGIELLENYKKVMLPAEMQEEFYLQDSSHK